MLNTMSEKLRVAGIVNDSITDGPGLRLAIFMQGCRKNCPGCHNPQAQPIEGGTLYAKEDLVALIDKNPLLAGVTLSGGEPLLQAQALLPLTKIIKARALDIAIYTGYTFEELLEQVDSAVMALLAACDTLVDGPYIDAQKSLTLPFRGSSNQRVLSLQQSLLHGKPVLESDARWMQTGSTHGLK